MSRFLCAALRLCGERVQAPTAVRWVIWGWVQACEARVWVVIGHVCVKHDGLRSVKSYCILFEWGTGSAHPHRVRLSRRSLSTSIVSNKITGPSTLVEGAESALPSATVLSIDVDAV